MSNIFKLSVSKTNTYLQCNKKYKFSYILKLPRKEFEYHIFGRFVHKALENFHLAIIAGDRRKDADIMFASFDDALQEFLPKISKDSKNLAIELLKQYLSQWEADKVKTSVLEAEKVFNIGISNTLLLTGMIDRIQLDNDGVYHIVDYKTSKSAQYLKNDLLQLLTYAFVIYNEHPEIEKVRVSYIMLKLGSQYITKEFSLDQILSIKQMYEGYANEILSDQNFKANPGILCKFCEFADLCDEAKSYMSGLYKTGKMQWGSK